MSRPSSIDQLDKDIRAEINRLRVDCGYTIEQIVGYLQSMNANISKSAVGRHVKKLAQVGERIRETRAVAEGLSQTISDKDDGELVNMNTELLHSAIMRLLSGTDEDGNDVDLKPSEAAAIGKALEAAAKAAKINADRVVKIRQQAAKETAKKAASAAETIIKEKAPGLSKETIDEIRLKVLGVAG